jgi:hypothetical protein
MGSLLRLLLLKFLPARLAWVVGAFVLARVLAGRRERATGPRGERTMKFY